LANTHWRDGAMAGWLKKAAAQVVYEIEKLEGD
jgi:hypothetical protein